MTSNSTTFSASVSEAVGSSKITALASPSARGRSPPSAGWRWTDRRPACRALNLHLELFEDLVGLGVERAFQSTRPKLLRRQFAQIDVFGHRHFLRQAEFLVDEHHALGLGLQRRASSRTRFSSMMMRPSSAGRCRQHLHQGRLAGAVLAHQGVNLARHDLEADAVERAHAGKGLDDAFKPQGRRCGRSYLQLLFALAVELLVEEQHRDQDHPMTRLTFRWRADMAQPLAQKLDGNDAAERADDRPACRRSAWCRRARRR
jgi:hypothetical protein